MCKANHTVTTEKQGSLATFDKSLDTSCSLFRKQTINSTQRLQKIQTPLLFGTEKR